MNEDPFSHDEVERVLFDKLLEKRRALAESSDPIKCKRLLSDIKALNQVSDMLYFNGLADHMHVIINDMIQGTSPRIVYASATLRPTFLNRENRPPDILADGAKAGTSNPDKDNPDYGPKAGVLIPKDGGKAGTLFQQMEVGQAPFSEDGGEAGVSIVADGRGAGTSTHVMEPRQAPSLDEWWRGVVIPDGWKAGTSTSSALVHGWNPIDDVAVDGEHTPSRSAPLSRLKERIKR